MVRQKPHSQYVEYLRQRPEDCALLTLVDPQNLLAPKPIQGAEDLPPTAKQGCDHFRTGYPDSLPTTGLVDGGSGTIDS